VPSCVISTVVTTFLSLLPELTEWRNRGWATPSTVSQGAGQAGALTEVSLSLEGLGCVACTSAVQGAINKVASKKVVSCSISLENKEAKIILNCDEVEARDSMAPDFIDQIQTAGFEATLTSINKATVSDGIVPEGMAGETLSAVVAGLLSSSCCVLQLAVNLLAYMEVLNIGCAGFNKVLGPFRMHLRALTFAWLGYLWFRSLRSRDSECCKPSRRRLVFNTILCLGLTFLPELLRWSGGPAIAPPTEGAKVLRLKVDGMGCEACEAHVRGVMDRASGVVSSYVDFQKGSAEMEVAENWSFNISSVLQKLANDGYDAQLVEKL